MEGIKRIEKMLEGQKDRYLQLIGKYLVNQVELDALYLNEEKNLKDMAEFIKNKARKQATENVAVIEDELVFNWAKEYFVKTNEELGIKKQKAEVKKEPAPEEVDEFGSIFENNTIEKNENKE